MLARHLTVTGPDTMQAQATALDPPAAGEVIVRVEAAGVSYGDILLRKGVIPGSPKPPFVPGYDFAGVIEKTGAGVALAPGRAVAALVPTGGYAERIKVSADRLVPRPEGASAVESAAIALNYFIAYQMLHRVAKVEPGQRVLVHGASGGVGVAFLQLAQLAGVEAYGSASAAKLDVVRKYGGIPIDYRAQDFVQVLHGKPVDAVFDAIGGSHFNRSSSVLRRGGIMVGYGQSAALVDGKPNMLIGARGFLGGIVLPKLVPNGKRTTFYNAWSLDDAAYREDLAIVLGLLATGKVEPLIAKTVPLTEAARAQQELEDGTVTGKIVLVP
ncbi:medium chain dehydrogenase/reductase family protein [Lentzea nigeriaca]|uniref:medium chain dehydrogenase/reductase family protein n=1 Tax=Lentzea nigeriaca TaxID=1128665 RepID=UPI0027DD274F|nr:medium chain dehydrogenase/reductase family protein [Lentzea nigeriaca]MBM7856364.1 NADPH:quinone reductase-like Zn-dependent oxidoreductase [Lentzea nigeriaca]